MEKPKANSRKSKSCPDNPRRPRRLGVETRLRPALRLGEECGLALLTCCPWRLVEQDLGVEEADGLGIPPSKAPRRTRSHSLGGDGPLSPPTPDHVQPPQCPLPKALSGTTDQDVFPFLMAPSPHPCPTQKSFPCSEGPSMTLAPSFWSIDGNLNIH